MKPCIPDEDHSKEITRSIRRRSLITENSLKSLLTFMLRWKVIFNWNGFNNDDDCNVDDCCKNNDYDGNNTNDNGCLLLV